MIFTSRFFVLLALGFLPIIGGALDPRLCWFGVAYDAAVIAVAVTEFLLLRSHAVLRVRRIVPAVASIGIPFPVAIEAENLSSQSLRVSVRDSPPDAFEAPVRAMVFELPPHAADRRDYTVRANLRGTFEFQEIAFCIRGVTGLCERQSRIAARQEIKIYPNVKNLSQAELAIARSSRTQYGLRLTRVTGEGREFESLRPYVRDDDYRWIDWKATARRSQLISREYESERNQRLMVLLDTGRLMSPRVGAFTKLDYAVNAAAMLCHVGLTKGDLVGLQVFANDVVAHLPPDRGRNHLVQLVNALFQAQPCRFESDYAMAFTQVARRNSRRTLVVCFTDLIDAESSRTLIQHMIRLLPKHLPLCVTISDSDLLAARLQVPTTAADVFEKVAATEVWQDYRRALGLLEGRGVSVVNVPAHELTTATINRYLEIKSRGQL